jgi:hypothetical protein
MGGVTANGPSAAIDQTVPDRHPTGIGLGATFFKICCPNVTAATTGLG